MPPVIPYVKQTWTDGVSSMSAARAGVIEQGIYEVSLAPAARVHHSVNQSITNATNTILAFNSERYDTCAGAADTQHDTATNNSRLTCRYAGKYSIKACVQYAVNATGERRLFLRLNGTTIIAGENKDANTGGAGTIMNIACDYDLAVNDYVEVMVHQTSGGALNVEVAANYSPEFMWHRAA